MKYSAIRKGTPQSRQRARLHTSKSTGVKAATALPQLLISGAAFVVSALALVVSLGANFDKVRPSWQLTAVLSEPPRSIRPDGNNLELMFINGGSFPAIVEGIEFHGERADHDPDSDVDTFYASAKTFDPFVVEPGAIVTRMIAFRYEPDELVTMETLVRSTGVKTKLLINVVMPQLGRVQYFDFLGYEFDEPQRAAVVPPEGFHETGSASDRAGTKTLSQGLAEGWLRAMPVTIIDKTEWFFGL